MRFVRFLALLAVVPLLASCAGGWRGGSAPAEWASSAATAPAPSAKGQVAASTANTTPATADGAVFVWKGEGSTVNVAGVLVAAMYVGSPGHDDLSDHAARPSEASVG